MTFHWTVFFGFLGFFDVVVAYVVALTLLAVWLEEKQFLPEPMGCFVSLFFDIILPVAILIGFKG